MKKLEVGDTIESRNGHHLLTITTIQKTEDITWYKGKYSDRDNGGSWFTPTELSDLFKISIYQTEDYNE